MFLTFKALHIIFVVTWFAGLFYLCRLFIYHTEAQDKSNPEREILSKQFLIMEKRLWYGITCPSAFLTIVMGLGMLQEFLPLQQNLWLVVKLLFVAVLVCYHYSLGRIFSRFKRNEFPYSSIQLRYWNEFPTILLISIIFLVIFKDTLAWTYGLAGLFLILFLITISIRIYRSCRMPSKFTNK